MTGEYQHTIGKQRIAHLHRQAEQERLAAAVTPSRTGTPRFKLLARLGARFAAARASTGFIHRRISGAAALCVIACALLGATFSGTALATSRVAAARAQGLYYASLRHEEPTIDKLAAAQAQGSYYASFRHENPLAPPRSPSSGTPWALAVTGLAIVLLVAAAVTVELRRLGGRRRAARV
ncbi:MAG: hypothetical protein JOZ73_07000 [Solirubrobacterales bacterium]|nr:hypothetical protein [Solirubrobacterales bacterium]